jgi:hypothetical protein
MVTRFTHANTDNYREGKAEDLLPDFRKTEKEALIAQLRGR